ncbi:FAD/NAD(P)-binding protein [Nocardiopsis baichengensis]|uniref:FAD/NAD(P)-binding protein n=1 Tax=Nocardiopsis baichengensis TaxID=280240 RepID=UPI00034CF68E|nr:FAD/NAD(P)-binding protein [Nocardiopsis baichengensis]
MDGSAAPGDGAVPLVAFAGGGPSAALAAIALLRATTWLRLEYRVVVFDDHGRRGRGSDLHSAERLDLPARLLSAFPDRPAHLLEWARLSGLACTPATFLPRRVYGDYLEDTLSATAAWAAPYAALEVRPLRVADARAEDGGVAVQTGGAPGAVAARALVVATGDPHLRRPPLTTGYDPAEGLATCPRGALIGTGGRAERHLFAVGPVRRGAREDTVPHTRDQAERLAWLICDTVLRSRAA